MLHFFRHKWILSGQPTDMPKKPTLSRLGDFFFLIIYPLSMVEPIAGLASLAGLTCLMFFICFVMFLKKEFPGFN